MTCDAILVELTQRCDRACAHCYNVWRHDRGYPPAELPRSELEPFVTRLLDRFSPRTVTLIGGEPLLHEGCADLVRLLSNRGIAVALSTHGGLVDTSMALSLALAGLRAAEVSLCSGSVEAGVAAACRAIALLDAQGIACTASIVLVRPWLERVSDLVARAAAFGAVGLSIHPLVEPIPGVLPAHLVPDEREFSEALEELARCSERMGMPARLSYPPGAGRVPASANELASNCCACDGSRRLVDAAGNVRWCEVDPRVNGTRPRRGCGGACRFVAPCGAYGCQAHVLNPGSRE